MHGSKERMKEFEAQTDVNETEATSGRTALHKAAFWGHVDTINYIVGLKADINLQDYNGDTALHDATRFGHEGVVDALLAAGADKTIKNKAGQDCPLLAKEYGKDC